MNSRAPMELAGLLGDLAIQMRADHDSSSLLQTIVTTGVDIIPGISWAGVSLTNGTTVTSAAPTDEVARALDELQNRLGEGPTISTLHDQESILVPDLGREDRWSPFVTEATRMGVRCLMAFRLFVKRETLGALTLYGPHPNIFDEDSLAVGEILAQHAAVAMAGAAAEEQLLRAVASRDLIGQAKGILMYRDRLTALQAFATLVRASQETNVKLTEVAHVLVSDFENGLTSTP